MKPERAQPDEAKLAELLEEALADLMRLRAQADAICETRARGARAGTGGVQALRPTLADGCSAITRRLEGLGRPFAATRDPFAFPFEDSEGEGAALTAYRPCFNRLGKALREARRISDEHTMAILSHLIVRLEKHLWLFDLPLAERHVVDWSAVNLFSLC